MKKLFLFILFPIQLFSQNGNDLPRLEKYASAVTIIRDNYGIPHIYGKTDADAVFGLMYAQCEDDFKRVELNYLEKLGMLSKVKGESELYNDLLIKILIDPEEAKSDYKKSPEWMKKLCNAWADGINYYVFKHAELDNPIGQYEPWMPFLWTDGSIGAINTAGFGAAQLKEFYGAGSLSKLREAKGSDWSKGSNWSDESKQEFEELVVTGSNGFAFSPKITASGKSILYINPHVTFYFRPEVHMVSEEGLNVYGAVTWGQFFIYQGFNEHCGWMHTSSDVDATDAYIEKLTQKKEGWFYTYQGKEKPVITKSIEITFKNKSGGFETRQFNTLFTHHGPIMGKKNAEFYSLRADNRLMNGLIQCWQRTKASGFEAFKKTLDLKGNISNNTVYADAEGNIAYWHGNRIPKKDPKFDWNKPVDGTIAATEWKGYHSLVEIIQSINPPNGWLQNCNSTPFTVAGTNSPKKNKYPSYMAPDKENFRGINAVRVLSEEKSYTIDKVIKAGYDTRLSSFEILIPALVKSFEKNIAQTDSLYALLIGPISVLKNWDYRCGENSIATTLAVFWGQAILPEMMKTKLTAVEDNEIEKAKQFAATATVKELVMPLYNTVNILIKRLGTWQTPWGEINRFQRISSDIDHKFDDSKPSIPVGFVSSIWGMLPSYTSRIFPGTNKRYGVNGNSFVCAVEFGKKIKAKSLLAGGESGHEDSPHFFDQGEMYSKGKFKDVLFYKEDVLKHVERKYHPGE